MDDVSASAAVPTIIFDFDGTLALGNGPLTAYALAVAARTGDTDFVTRAYAAVVAYEAGDVTYRDGYDAIARVAAADGVPADVLGDAYDASRALLGTADAAVTAPEDLPAFLARVGASARLVLATNAPGDSVTTVLRTWSIADCFDALHFRVGKPAGLVPVVRNALASGPVLSVGDIVEFDLAPAAALGADTALVGPAAGRTDALVTLRGRTLADLYDEIAAWATSATTPLSRTPDTTLTPERHS